MGFVTGSMTFGGVSLDWEDAEDTGIQNEEKAELKRLSSLDHLGFNASMLARNLKEKYML